jgi:YVTN family beta-propeller protein
LNLQTGLIITVNSLSNTISLVDTQTLQTVQTIGIGASGPLAVAVSPIKNLAVISDQGNNRVLLLPLP